MTTCHLSPRAAALLDLSAGQSRGNVVNIDSGQKPGEKLVAPGLPGRSYLLSKVRGERGIKGAQMPIGRPALSLEQVKLIEAWIAAGAGAK